MRVLAGLEFGGTTLTEFDALELGRGNVGDVAWSPSQLLRDLELRSGLSSEVESEAVRVAHWTARIATQTASRFYSNSFKVDALGTARALLRLRDSLVEAGWNGQPIPDGGARLEALVELESLGAPPLPEGYADRLAKMALSLPKVRSRLYTEVQLADAIELWPSRWRVIFRALEQGGTRFSRHQATLRGAPPDTDLGRVQAALRASSARDPVHLLGDGSVVLLTAETSTEAARATAAVLTTLHAEQTVVIRQDDVSALDNALAAQDSRTQGWRSVSPWRAALQVLPLALELAFEPKDPQRVLELLTLPISPFLGLAGRRLAVALTQSPGIGSPAWEEAKTKLTSGDAAIQVEAETSTSDREQQLLRRIAEWLEQRGDDAVSGAPKSALLEVVDRARAWLVSRIPGTPDDANLLTAVRHAGALRAALEGDPRATFSLVELRRVAESVVETGTLVQLLDERAGRIAYVDSPGGLQISCSNVVWWSFADTATPGASAAWRRTELAALSQAGIGFPDPKARLAERAASWRRAVQAATERVLFVAPRRRAGDSLALHPLWDEIMARSQADGPTQARITINARELRTATVSTALLPQPPLQARKPVPLPGGHHEWTVPAEALSAIVHFSPASLNALLGCPLQWALQYRAGVNAGGHALPPLYMLNGTLGHRLVELLFGLGAFDLADSSLERSAESQLEQLFVREGAILLRAGMAFERSQLRRQLVESVLELARALRSAQLRILEVEKAIEISWRGVQLVGRIDLLVESQSGVQAIIDMKWGLSSYRDLLRSGQALQLAVYAFGHAAARGDQTLPEATYFSLKQRKLFGLSSDLLPNAEVIHGPTLAGTWTRIERSVERASRLASNGRFPVTGVRRSLPLLTSFGVPDGTHDSHFALERELSCKYCGFDALCGRRWEARA